MDVYRGADKVAEFESYDELRVGANRPAFVYEGNELVYPDPVKDGLVLWYDFSGRTNSDGQRGIADDLSGNGNHGTLQNFNFTAESGYDENKLLFDGVDDILPIPIELNHSAFTLEMVVELIEGKNGYLIWRQYSPTNIGIWKHSDSLLRIYLEGSEGNMPWIGFENFELNTPIHITLTLDTDVIRVYKNGVEVVFYNQRKIGSILGKIEHHFNVSRFHYSTKFYNKALTPEEIAHNYKIEKERFGIE